MKFWSLPMALPGLLCCSAAAHAVPVGQSYAQITVQQTVIVRVPDRHAKPKPIRWKTKKGPKCVEMATIAGAAIVAEDSIDLVLRGGQRLRALFSSRCPALDYYSGFYMLPTDDGRICADRDVIRTRSGGQCEIQKFRKLIPIGGNEGE